jgi:hypothetical protein
MDMPTSFIWITILFNEASKYDDATKFWDYVETNNEPLCVEFCNSVQCHISVNDYTCYY